MNKNSLMGLVAGPMVLFLLSACDCKVHCSKAQMARLNVVPLRDVHFGFDSAKISPTAQIALREDFEQFGLGRQGSNSKIILQGHADERGASNYNLKLSEKRVVAVKKYLLSLGASESRFEVRSLGEESPVVEGSNAEAWAKNRTVQVSVN